MGDAGTEISPRLTDPKAVKALVKRAEQGDRKAFAELRPLLDAAPKLLAPYDLPAITRRAWINRLSGDDLLMQDAVERQAQQLRSELAGPAPTPREALLVDRVVVCWLQVQYADTIYAQNLKDASIKVLEYQQRRCEVAQRRYLAAIRTLAQVRRLLTPAVQVNIAENQVNVAG